MSLPNVYEYEYVYEHLYIHYLMNSFQGSGAFFLTGEMSVFGQTLYNTHINDTFACDYSLSSL